jgi:hypothetical protein
MDLRREDLTSLNRLGGIWKTTPGAEFEAMMTNMDLTAWQDVIQYLRSLGMREKPQIVRMNVCLSNNLRFTLEGAGVIQAYCRDNRIADKPFTAMLKENIQDGEPVNLNDYGAKAKLKRETALSADDERVKEALLRWDQLGKHFRMIQRFEFQAPKGLPLRFDVSLVRENAGRPARTFQEARVTTAAQTYEAEVELTAKREGTEGDGAARLVLRGLSWLLQGRQRAFVLVGNRRADFVRNEVGAIFGSGANVSSNARNGRNRAGPTRSFRFPGPQPATLERRHVVDVSESGIPSVRGGYNVTDKADGLRCLLYVSDIGRIYLVDGGGRVYATGKQAEKAMAGLVLDGEWIRRDREGRAVSHYYAFDIMATAGGDAGIVAQPFLIPGAMLGSAVEAGTRMGAMKAAVAEISKAKQLVKGVPSAQNIQIGMKSFQTAEGTAIFREAAAATLDSAERAPYNTDGLIFTPNAAPLPIGQGTWAEQLKWKPPQENTIDFFVVVDAERDKAGVPLGTDAINIKYREDSGQTVRCKTLRLFVGSSRDVAFADPRRTILDKEPLPSSAHNGDWAPVEFRPTDPRDPMAAICYVPINAGAADPAGATVAATALDTDTDMIRTTRTGDIIQSDMIVEMAYHPERAAGWRWEPVRVRHDKTERWRAGRTGGTMNADWVANSIWSTLHNPITEAMVRTGVVENCTPTPPTMSRVPSRNLMKVQCMHNFHNDVIKRRFLLHPTLAAGAAGAAKVCDLGIGHGEDVVRYITANVSYVLGVDINGDAINNPTDGAYRRLLDKMVALGGRDRVPPMVFVQASAARNLPSGSAGITAEDQTLLQTEFSTGPAASGFDVVSAMFSLQYMFSDENTLAGFLNTLADTVKVGGYFVGCAPDGDAVASQFAREKDESGVTVVGRDGKMDVWTMTRRYSAGMGTVVPPTTAGLGLAVDVDFIAAGQTYTQYLVSWPYLEKRLAEAGLELLTAEEIAELRLPASSQMFSETWSIAEAAGDKYAMTDAVRRLSFMNRWWVFRRRSDRRPAPPMAEPEFLAPLTEMKPATEVVDIVATPELSNVMTGGGSFAGEVSEAAAPFLVNAAVKTPDERLGPDLADWPRYMSLGTLTPIHDMADPSVIYPSIEAAVASAKYQSASNIPAQGPALFRVEGSLHQRFDTERKRLEAEGAPADAIAETVNNQVSRTRIVSGKPTIKSYGGEYDLDKWLSVRDEVNRAYLQIRYNSDPRFKQMVDTIKAQGGEILFANGDKPNDLGVGIGPDGNVLGGGNLIGKIMMTLE